MNASKCVAMVLAGGRGERLGALTRYYSKPAVQFGGSHRIIDFTLNNCMDSGVTDIGVLTQCFSDDLHGYINDAYNSRSGCGIHMLPSQGGKNPYVGTADAVYKNIIFIERLNPEYVLVLAGDHIYSMDYREMIDSHRRTDADITVASTPVLPYEASRFGIISADSYGKIYEFEEKPSRPKSNLASMGIYAFKWSVLKRYLLADNEDRQSRHDFGRDILPLMLGAGEKMYTHVFGGYWRDVGTLDSLWSANMDQVYNPDIFSRRDEGRRLSDPGTDNAPCHASHAASISHSIISAGCSIYGRVDHSVLSGQVTVSKGAEVSNSVIMAGVHIGDNVKIRNAVVGPRAAIMADTVIGADTGTDFFIDQAICANGVSLVAPWLYIREGMTFKGGSHIYRESLMEYEARGAEMTAMPDSRQNKAEYALSRIDRPLRRAGEMV